MEFFFSGIEMEAFACTGRLSTAVWLDQPHCCVGGTHEDVGSSCRQCASVSAFEMKAAAFKGAETVLARLENVAHCGPWEEAVAVVKGMVVDYSTNELEVDCCAAKVERVVKYEERLEASNTSAASEKATRIAYAFGAVDDGKGHLHGGRPPGHLSVDYVQAAGCGTAKVERVVEHGKRFEASNTSAVSNKAGVLGSVDVHNFAYQYSYIDSVVDMLKKDFVTERIGLSHPLASHQSPLRAKMSDHVLDNAVDWTQQGAVNPIKIRDQCVPCLAFSTDGTLE